MTEAGNDPNDSRALMRAYLEQRKTSGPITSSEFLQTRPDADDALRGWLQAAESWTEDEIEQRLQKLDDESSAMGNTVPIDVADALDQTLPLDPSEFDELKEPPFDGRYKIVNVIGEGGCGKVYLVEDLLQDNEKLALKVVRTDLADSEQFEQRFRNEIRVLRALSHPRIPQIFNDGKTPDGDIYYTMSFVAGASLADILDDEAPLEPGRIVDLVRQIIEVLEYAHSKGVVHRDLKPSNIMILEAGTEDEQVRVLDFGIAKILTREGALENAKTMETMAMLGTPHYMSPEQVSGQPIDPSTDIYALGVIVYQMCSGKLPFTGGAVMELLTARLRNKPPQLANEDIPTWLRRLVSQLLELEGRKRPSTKQIHAIFERGMQVGSKNTRRNMLTLGAAGLLALVGVYSLYSMYANSSGDDEGAKGGPPQVAVLSPGPNDRSGQPSATEPTGSGGSEAGVDLNREEPSTEAPTGLQGAQEEQEVPGEVQPDPDGSRPADSPGDEESGAVLGFTGTDTGNPDGQTADGTPDTAEESVPAENDGGGDSGSSGGVVPIPIPIPLPGGGGGVGLPDLGGDTVNVNTGSAPAETVDPSVDLNSTQGSPTNPQGGSGSESAPVVESVSFTSPEEDLVTNLDSLSIEGNCSPAMAADLEVGLAGQSGRSTVRTDGDGDFAQSIPLPDEDGTFTIVVESDGRRVGQRSVRVDRNGPRLLEEARLLNPGPFAFEEGPIQAHLRFDEPTVLLTAEGVECHKLPWGSGLASFPLPAVHSADPESHEVTLRAVDDLGNESELVIPVEIFSAAMANLTEATVDDLDGFTFTTDSSKFPPRIGYDTPGGRFLVPHGRGVPRVWKLPEGIVLMGRLESIPDYHVFGINSGKERTQMVLVCGARAGMSEVSPFLMDRREVAWSRYRAFMEDSPGDGRSYRDYGQNQDNDVVAGVQWRDADAFARWAGKQLPSGTQWEAAASWNGEGAQLFPWGAEFLPDAVAIRGINEAIQANDAGLDRSPYGIIGMGAGVREWIGDMPADRSRRMARGGTSYAQIPFGFTLADDYEQSPSTYDNSYGARTAEKTLRLLETSANIKDVGLRCIIPLESR